MSRLARWCFDHRRRASSPWLLARDRASGLARRREAPSMPTSACPNTDSQAAVSLLAAELPGRGRRRDQVVIQATTWAAIRSPSVQAAVIAALTRWPRFPRDVGRQPLLLGRMGQISRDGTIAFAKVTWNISLPTSPRATRAYDHGRRIRGRAQCARLARGPGDSNSERPTLGASVVVGIIAALIILLIVFGGAVLASLLPLAGTAVALVIGLSLVRLLTHTFDVASQSIDLAVLIGLGVGVDYGLFIVSRHRSAVMAGRSYRQAAAEAVDTSGRTVLFAGAIVCIALLGQFALGVNFLYGPSAAAAIAVALTMARSLTLLPALLGFLGPGSCSRRERSTLEPGAVMPAARPGSGCGGLGSSERPPGPRRHRRARRRGRR